MSDAGQLIQNRYRLVEKLGEGGMGVVWRAFDRLTGQTVALKQVRHPSTPEHPNDSQGALALGREFQTLSTLRHPHIISVLDYGFDDGQPYLTMLLLDGAKALSADVFIQLERPPHDILLDILAALTYLHRRGVIHCDLKPSNVMIDLAGVVRLIDFGIAAAPDGTSKSSGTLNYLAPELLTGAPLSYAADLYAVGVMAYEFYAGAHPFDDGDVSGLLTRVLYDEPDLTPLPPALQPWIGRLLSKKPDERYVSAGAAIRALCNTLDIAFPSESIDIRESFLQSASFVGRERELETLNVALKSTLAGKGAALVISGESGVGKSRLVDELRVAALVSGARVVRGQAAEGGGLPYQMWREILPILLLDAQPSARDAAVLSLILPDAPRLTGHPAPKRLPKDAHKRLPKVVASLIRAQSHPLVLLFEDVQWAGESLALLREALPLAVERPVLMIATHRFDEQPTFPPELSDCQVLRLERLTPQDVTALCGAMLGDVGRSAGLVAQLQQETEGNVFFLVEVVRALAEEAGGLGQIAPDALFTATLTGGIRALMRRRIERLPEWARPLMTLAAVAGRRLDPAVLAKLITADAPPVADWLTICADAALIEVSDGAWRFRHDKIREALLADIDSLEVAALHGQVAAAIEAVYAADTAYSPTLALHWSAAGDWVRAMEHIRTAVDGWRAVSAYKEAQRLLIQMLDRLGAGDSAERAELLTFLGEMYIEVGQFGEAFGAYSTSLDLAERLNLTDILPSALIGVTYFEFRTGSLQGAMDKLTRVLDAPLTDPLTRIRALNLKTVMYDGQLSMTEARALLEEALSIADQHDLLEGRLLTYQNLGPHYLVHDDKPMALKILHEMADLAEQSGNALMGSAAYVNMAEIYLGDEDMTAAAPVIDRLEALTEQTEDLYLGAWVWKLRARVSKHNGDMAGAMEHLGQAIQRFEAIGALGDVAFVRAWLILYHIMMGQAVTAADNLPKLLAESRQVGGMEQIELTVGAYALVAMLMGDTAQAADWRAAMNSVGQTLRGGMVTEMLSILDSGLDSEDLSDATTRARYPDVAAAFESLAESGW